MDQGPVSATVASQPFDRRALGSAPTRLLHEGRWANARVSVVQVDGVDWVVKDFAPRSFWVRNTIGRLLVRRELRALQRLAGIDGVPAGTFRVDAHALASRFIPGIRLKDAPPGSATADYFVALERLMERVHERGVVHLDTRGTGNLLVRPDGQPAVIDFQAALHTGWMPRAFRRWFERLDMGGVYKRWSQRDPGSMGQQRRDLYDRLLRQRRWWVLRGYAGLPKKPRPGTR